MIMRIAAFLLCLLFVLVGCGAEPPHTPAEPQALAADSGSVHPLSESLGAAANIALPTLDGDSLRLVDYQGRVVLLNFWATWCAPCREEIPDLSALHAQFQSQGLTVLGVSLDETGIEGVQAFADEFDITYPLAHDARGALAEAVGNVYGLPTTLVIDAKGNVVHRVVGIYPVEQMQPVLDELLADAGTKS